MPVDHAKRLRRPSARVQRLSARRGLWFDCSLRVLFTAVLTTRSQRRAEAAKCPCRRWPQMTDNDRNKSASSAHRVKPHDPDETFSATKSVRRLLPLTKTHRVVQRPPFECIALVLQGGGALGSYQAESTRHWPRPTCIRTGPLASRSDPSTRPSSPATRPRRLSRGCAASGKALRRHLQVSGGMGGFPTWSAAKWAALF
jgi:hypothetical protein